MNYYDLAIRRKSTRSFKNKKVPAETLSQILNEAASCEKLVPDLQTEWKLLDEGIDKWIAGCAGYHGYMIDAPHYLLLLSADGPHDLENAGYAGEDIVLKLTQMGLATCWITILDPDGLKMLLRLDSPLKPAALIAFGYEKAPIGGSTRIDIKSPSDSQMQQRTGHIAPKLYVKESVYQASWGSPCDLSAWESDSSLYRALIAACCAPSALNRQPYRFLMDKNFIYLACMKDELTTPSDARLNLGIVMLHFAMVISHQNTLHGQWELSVPETDYHLPEGAYIAGRFQI